MRVCDPQDAPVIFNLVSAGLGPYHQVVLHILRVVAHLERLAERHLRHRLRDDGQRLGAQHILHINDGRQDSAPLYPRRGGLLNLYRFLAHAGSVDAIAFHHGLRLVLQGHQHIRNIRRNRQADVHA